MDANEIYFASRDLAAQWVAAGSACIAATAAIIAGVFAARAWRSQERQESNSVRQLEIALGQHRAFLDAAERERRAMGPLFAASPLVPIAETCTKDFGSVYAWEQVILSGEYSSDPTSDIAGIDAIQEGWNLWGLVYVSNSVEIRGDVRIKAIGADNILQGIEISRVKSLDGSEEDHHWLMRIPNTGRDGEIDFMIAFETGTGFVDTQEYRLSIMRHSGLGRILLRRLDPGGVEGMLLNKESSLPPFPRRDAFGHPGEERK
ncbi:MAG: hypothetical protein EOP87_00995 [Verrucomicrobiaceae bacterium]|nr:MAG: hypothetical protein EOP87_00995 [Verrucomicrobiaceae bacterium]